MNFDSHSLAHLIKDSQLNTIESIEYECSLILNPSGVVNCEFTFLYPCFLKNQIINSKDYYHGFVSLTNYQQLHLLTPNDWYLEYHLEKDSESKSQQYLALAFDFFEVYNKTNFFALFTPTKSSKFNSISLDFNYGVYLESHITIQNGEYYLKCTRDYRKKYR